MPMIVGGAEQRGPGAGGEGRQAGFSAGWHVGQQAVACGQQQHGQRAQLALLDVRQAAAGREERDLHVARYEKTSRNFLGMVLFAAITLWLK